MQYDSYCIDRIAIFDKIRGMPHTFERLDAIATLTSGHAFRRSLGDEPLGDMHVVTMAHVIADVFTIETELPKIDFSGATQSLQLAEGDLLFRARGISNQATFVESAAHPCVFAAPLIRIRVKNTSETDSHYLQWAINSRPMQQTITAEARGSVIKMVTLQSLRRLQVPLPDIAVQRRIAEIARLMRSEQIHSEALIAKRKDYAEQILWAKAQEVR